MLNSVYNYLISNQLSQNNQQRNWGKRAVLSDTYHSILKINSKSALYMINLTRETSEFVISLKEAALAIQRQGDMIPLSISPFLDNVSDNLNDSELDNNPTYKLDILEQFSSSYNHFISIASSQKENNRFVSLLLSELEDIVNSSRTALSSSGITFNDTQKMNIDSNKLLYSFQDGSFQSLYQSETSFFHSIQKRMKQLSLNPIEYLNKTMITYPNPFQSKFTSPYFTSLYSGMLFHDYC